MSADAAPPPVAPPPAPPGADSPGVWETYKWPIVAVVAVLVICLCVFVYYKWFKEDFFHPAMMHHWAKKMQTRENAGPNTWDGPAPKPPAHYFDVKPSTQATVSRTSMPPATNMANAADHEIAAFTI